MNTNYAMDRESVVKTIVQAIAETYTKVLAEQKYSSLYRDDILDTEMLQLVVELLWDADKIEPGAGLET